MNTLTYLNGCFDAGDIPSAAACILADPVSMVLQPRSIDRLYRIAFDQANTTPADVVMIGIIGDIMAARYRQ
jgi:hypothetical protein